MHKSRDKNGYFVMKIDLAKAYDRLNWSFLNKVITEVGLLDKMKTIIREAISGVKMTVL